jgi:hypothetical protein
LQEKVIIIIDGGFEFGTEFGKAVEVGIGLADDDD